MVVLAESTDVYAVLGSWETEGCHDDYQWGLSRWLPVRVVTMITSEGCHDDYQ